MYYRVPAPQILTKICRHVRGLIYDQIYSLLRMWKLRKVLDWQYQIRKSHIKADCIDDCGLN